MTTAADETAGAGQGTAADQPTSADLLDRVDTLRGAVAPPPAAADDDRLRVLTGAQCALLAAVQDRLIPPDGDLPGAGALGAAWRVDALVAQQVEWRRDLLAVLQAIDAAGGATGFPALPGGAQDDALHQVEAAQPLLFQRLLRLTYTAYYTDERVQRALSGVNSPPQPAGHGMTTFDESWLEPVKARGKLWRDA
jgi:hypothetical protein